VKSHYGLAWRRVYYRLSRNQNKPPSTTTTTTTSSTSSSSTSYNNYYTGAVAPTTQTIVNGKVQTVTNTPHFADAKPVNINGKEVYVSSSANNSGLIYSDAPPVVVNDYSSFLKNINQFACGYQAGKKLEYEIDDNCRVDYDECKLRDWVCLHTITQKDGKGVKICCKWK